MDIALLVFLAVAVIVVVLVARARRRRSWDNTDAWDAVKRVGHDAARRTKGDGIRPPPR